jgi:hypothetical protein
MTTNDLTTAEHAALETAIGEIKAWRWLPYNGVPSLIVETRDDWYQFDSLEDIRSCLRADDFRPFKLPF